MRALGAGVVATLAVPAFAQQAQRVEKIEVTGSNIKRIEGETGLPVTVITREQLQREGIQTAMEAIEKLSSNSSVGGINLSGGIGATGTGFNSASLRGLGGTRTLVLMNGRRLANTAFNGGMVDLNAIPLSAVERVEVLTDGASAIYGTDAIAGVINFILRKDFTGVDAYAYFGDSDQGGGKTNRYSGTVGFGWQPNSDFRATARYEYRDRGGVGQVLSFGAAGRIADGITALSRIQWSRGSFTDRSNSALDGTAALAIRPLETDRYGLLFSYNHRSLFQDGLTGQAPTRDSRDTLSTDGYYQPCKDLELFGRVALNFNGNGQTDLPYVSTLTYLTQARAQYHFSKRMDGAIETRMIFQPSSGTTRTSTGAELGFWVLPDLRLGAGYNFAVSREPFGSNLIPQRRGFYFTITSKLSRLFDLFGTSKAGLAPDANADPPEKQK